MGFFSVPVPLKCLASDLESSDGRMNFVVKMVRSQYKAVSYCSHV